MKINDLCDLENKVKVMRFELCLWLPWDLSVPILMRGRQIFLHILSRNHLKWILNALRGLEKEVRVTRFNLGSPLTVVPLCTKFSKTP